MSVGKVMTYEEMAREFAEQWVLVLDPVMDEQKRVVKGRVGAHGPDRDAVYDAGNTTPESHIAFLCFKPMPAHFAF